MCASRSFLLPSCCLFIVSWNAMSKNENVYQDEILVVKHEGDAGMSEL